MPYLRTRLCSVLVLMTASALAAQGLRNTIGPVEQKAYPVTAENPIPPRTQSAFASYPEEARALGAAATVVLAVTVGESGCIAEIRRGPEPTLTTPSSVPAEAVDRAADAFVREAVDALQFWRYAKPAQAPISFGVSFTFKPDAVTTATQSAAPVPLPSPSRASEPVRVRVGSVNASPRLVVRVQPVYPAEAVAARVEGIVILEVFVDTTGKVTNARVLRSVPLLDQAALDAVRQWVYAPPPCLGGAPVPVILTVTVRFTLP